MKKTKIFALLLVLCMTVSILTACGQKAAFNNYYNKNLEEKEVLKCEPLDVPDGFSLSNTYCDGNILQFDKGDFIKFYSLRTGKLIFEDTLDKKCIYEESDTYPVFTRNYLKDDVYHSELYNIDGELLTDETSKSDYASFETMDDREKLFAFGNKIFSNVDEVCKYVRDYDLSMYSNLEDLYFYNDKYIIYTSGDLIKIHDIHLNPLYIYAVPSYSDEFDYYILSNGNVLVQYTYEVDRESKHYDFMVANNDKYMLETILIDVEKGTEKKVKCDFYLESLVSPYMVGEERFKSVYNTKKIDNIIYYYVIEGNQKRIDFTQIKTANMGNNVKIKNELPSVIKGATFETTKIYGNIFGLMDIASLEWYLYNIETEKYIPMGAGLVEVGVYGIIDERTGNIYDENFEFKTKLEDITIAVYIEGLLAYTKDDPEDENYYIYDKDGEKVFEIDGQKVTNVIKSNESAIATYKVGEEYKHVILGLTGDVLYTSDRAINSVTAGDDCYLYRTGTDDKPVYLRVYLD